MYGPIFGSYGQQVGYRDGMDIFNLKQEKRFDVDISGNLINPLTRKIEGHLQPAGSSLLSTKSLDHLF